MATAETSTSVVTSPLGNVDVPYVEVYDEPLHPTVLNNKHVRVIKAGCPANQETMFHRHSQDSFFVFFEFAKIRNVTVGKDPFEVELDEGAFYWGDHLTNPIIHKICVGERKLNCMDIEFKADRPKPASPFLPLSSTASRELCLENDVMRAYRVTAAPGEDVYSTTLAAEEGVASESPYAVVAMKDAKKLSGGVVKAGDLCWRDGGSGDGVEEKFACEEGAELMVVQPK